MKSRFTQLFALALFTILSSVASAATIDIDFSNNTWDGLGSPFNESLSIDLAAVLGVAGDVLVTGIGWDVEISTNGVSWLSEATIGFGSDGGVSGLDLRPGGNDGMPGSGAYSSAGLLDLVDLELAFVVIDGILSIEFFETFDDEAGVIDATISGTVTLVFESATPVPVPAAVWLFASGLLGLIGARRRS